MGNAVQIKALFFSLIRGSPGAEIVFLNQDLAICPRSVFRDFYAHLPPEISAISRSCASI